MVNLCDGGPMHRLDPGVRRSLAFRHQSVCNEISTYCTLCKKTGWVDEQIRDLTVACPQQLPAGRVAPSSSGKTPCECFAGARAKSVKLLELHGLLSEILVDPETGWWILDRRITSKTTERAVAQSCVRGLKRCNHELWGGQDQS